MRPLCVVFFGRRSEERREVEIKFAIRRMAFRNYVSIVVSNSKQI